jgi:hypothetical protein
VDYRFMDLSSSIGQGFSITDQGDLVDRCFRASEFYWEIANLDVHIMISDSQEGHQLRGLLHALGLTVFNGTDHLERQTGNDIQSDASAVFIVHVSDWLTDAFLRELKKLRVILPDAIICVVTGFGPVPETRFSPKCPDFDDARALLFAAGVEFFSALPNSLQQLT